MTSSTTSWGRSSEPKPDAVPEILELEQYRRAAETVVGREVSEVLTPDAWYCKGGTEPDELRLVLVGHSVTGVRRHGKLLLVDIADRVVGLRFGMTGRLIADGSAPIERLEYSSGRDNPDWDRFALVFTDGGDLRIRDPRRLGGVELDPDVGRLGPDAWTLTVEELAEALGTSTVALKGRLLDQRRVAGLGNLLVDEILWRAGLDPGREASSLGAAEQQRLQSEIRTTLDELDDRGGSHRGDLHDERHRAGRCPHDGNPLRRRTIGGRTTYDCPAHQR